jgi:hypothetical protein
VDKKVIIRVGVVSFLLGFLLFFVIYLPKIVRNTRPDVSAQPSKTSDVVLPQIVAGQLVVPTSGESLRNLKPSLAMVSVNLVGIYDKNQLSAIRILGTIKNLGNSFVDSFTPVVKFLDVEGKVTAQKIAHLSANYSFFGLSEGEEAVVDITADEPPVSDRVEIILSASSSGMIPESSQIKIQNKRIETVSASASGQTVDVYRIEGEIVNTRSLPVSDISIFGWVVDDQGRVFGLARQDFKSDLLNPGGAIAFKMMVLPVRVDSKFSDWQLQAWAKEYKL